MKHRAGQYQPLEMLRQVRRYRTRPKQAKKYQGIPRYIFLFHDFRSDERLCEKAGLSGHLTHPNYALHSFYLGDTKELYYIDF